MRWVTWFAFTSYPASAMTPSVLRPLIAGLAFGALMADKAFDSDWIVNELNERGAGLVISQHPRRAKPISIDTEIYK